MAHGVLVQAGCLRQCHRVWRGALWGEPKGGATESPAEDLELARPPAPAAAQACAAIVAALPGSVLCSASHDSIYV